MKAALGLVALLALAVGAALLVGGNQASVTFFWTPYRMDVSLNLFLLVLALCLVVMHLAWRAIGGLFELQYSIRRKVALKKGFDFRESNFGERQYCKYRY